MAGEGGAAVGVVAAVGGPSIASPSRRLKRSTMPLARPVGPGGDGRPRVGAEAVEGMGRPLGRPVRPWDRPRTGR